MSERMKEFRRRVGSVQCPGWRCLLLRARASGEGYILQSDIGQRDAAIIVHGQSPHGIDCIIPADPGEGLPDRGAQGTERHRLDISAGAVGELEMVVLVLEQAETGDPHAAENEFRRRCLFSMRAGALQCLVVFDGYLKRGKRACGGNTEIRLETRGVGFGEQCSDPFHRLFDLRLLDDQADCGGMAATSADQTLFASLQDRRSEIEAGRCTA